jgi:hypothetical protein
MNETKLIQKISLKKNPKCIAQDCIYPANLYDFTIHKLFRCFNHKIMNDYHSVANNIYRWDGKYWRPKCENIYCCKRPGYGQLSDMTALRCSEHAFGNDVNFVNKKCEFNGCQTQPSFGNISDKIRLRCVVHRIDGDEDCVSKKCEETGCKTCATFGSLADNRRKRCGAHRFDDDVDLVSKMCEFTGCSQYAEFGNNLDKKRLRCRHHRLDTDENVKNIRCGIDGCKTSPSFGDPNGKALRCYDHKLDTDEDIVSPRCGVNGCKTQPIYGNVTNKNSRRCKKHKLDTDKNVLCKRCGVNNCETRPIFGDPTNRIPIYCAKHKLSTYRDVCNKMCIKCGIRNVKLYDMCNGCDPFLTRRVEYKVVNFLMSHEETILNDFVHNKSVYDQTSRGHRPDILYRFNTHSIIVEVDENQHEYYDQIDEHNRVLQICEALKDNVVFIRFNPHKHRVGKFTFDIPFDQKLAKLVNCIIENINTKPTQPMTIVKLYYDEL